MYNKGYFVGIRYLQFFSLSNWLVFSLSAIYEPRIIGRLYNKIKYKKPYI